MQAFFAEPSVQAFGRAVLPRLAGGDLAQPYSFLSAPGLPPPPNELRSMVTAHLFRPAALWYQPFQHPDEAQARQTGIDFNGRAFPPVLINERERTQRLSVRQAVAAAIQRPVLVRRKGLLLHGNNDGSYAVPTFPAKGESPISIQAVHSLVVG